MDNTILSQITQLENMSIKELKEKYKQIYGNEYGIQSNKVYLVRRVAYKIQEADLYFARRGHFNEPRNVAVFLVRYLRNDTLNQVGRQFGIEKYSTVSSIIERVKNEMNGRKGFKKRVEEIADKIIKSHRKT